MNEVAYHGTCTKYKESIEKNGFDPKITNHRNDHWLGQGVYFFIDFNQSMWWANSIASKNSGASALIYKSNIVADSLNVLDLDDYHQLQDFIDYSIDLFKEIERTKPAKLMIFDNKKLRAVLVDYYKTEKNYYVVIATFTKRIAGYIKHRDEKELGIQDKIFSMIGLGYKERQICVSKKDCIKNTVLFYNGEEEVV